MDEEQEYESFIQYGHFTKEVGWVVEPRGRNYATSQRTVYLGPVMDIQDWSFDG